MTEKELEKARQYYKNYQEEKQKIQSKKDELEKLKKTKEVIRYLELLEYENERIYTEEEILDLSFFCSAFETTSNKNIYVYKGSYTSNTIPPKFIPDTTKSSHYYNEYTNIETGHTVHIGNHSIKEFEKNNIIIKIVDEDNVTRNQDFYKNLYDIIKREYYKLLIEKSQEKVIEEIKTKAYNVKCRKFK